MCWLERLNADRRRICRHDGFVNARESAFVVEATIQLDAVTCVEDAHESAHDEVEHLRLPALADEKVAGLELPLAYVRAKCLPFRRWQIGEAGKQLTQGLRIDTHGLPYGRRRRRVFAGGVA